MLNWIWSRRPSSDRRASMAPAVRPWRRAICSTGQTRVVFLQQLLLLVRPPAAAGVDGLRAGLAGLQLLQDAVQRPDNFGVVIDALVRQTRACDRVAAVGEPAEQLRSTLDLHTLTFSVKFRTFASIIVYGSPDCKPFRRLYAGNVPSRMYETAYSTNRRTAGGACSREGRAMPSSIDSSGARGRMTARVWMPPVDSPVPACSRRARFRPWRWQRGLPLSCSRWRESGGIC